MKAHLTALLSLLLFSSAPLFAAKTFRYVVLAREEVHEALSFETSLTATNPTKGPLTFTVRMIPTATDGTPPDGLELEELSVPAGETRVFTKLTGGLGRGMLVIYGDEELAFYAQLKSTGGSSTLGSQIPIIAAPFDAGTTALVQNVQRFPDSITTNFGLVNFKDQSIECTYKVFRFSGEQILSTIQLSHPPLSHSYFGDVLNVVSTPMAANVHIRTSCDGPFYPFADLVDLKTGELDFIRPRQTGTASFVPTVDGCPVNAICSGVPGLFFVSTPGQPQRQFVGSVPPGVYKKARLKLDVTHGGWRGGRRYANFWFVTDGNQNMLGYLLFLPTDGLRLVHGLGVNNFGKTSTNRFMEIIPGETYSFDYTYDTETRNVLLTVVTQGREVLRINSFTNVNRINIPGGRFEIHMSFTGRNTSGNEPASIGWGFSDLYTEFTPK